MKSYMMKNQSLDIEKMMENGWKEFDPDKEYKSYQEFMVIKTKHSPEDLECVIIQYIPKEGYTTGDYVMPYIRVKHSINRNEILLYKDTNQIIVKNK